MVDISGRSFIKPNKTATDVDLTKYATKEEVDNLLNLAKVDPDEVAVFQDKQGKLKSSNIRYTDIILRVPGAIQGNFVSFSDGGRIRDSSINPESINSDIEKSVSTAFNKSLKKAGD